MTKSKKILLGFGIFLILLCLLSLWLPHKVVSIVKKDVPVQARFLKSLVSDISTYSYWHTKAMADNDFKSRSKLSWTNQLNKSSYQSEQYPQGILSIVSQQNDTIVLVDSSSNVITSKYFISKKDDKNSSISITSEKETGFFINLLNLVHKWKLSKAASRQIDGITKEAARRSADKIYYNYLIKEVGMEKRDILAMRSNVEKKNIIPYYSQNIASIYQKAQTAGIVTKGSPFVLYFSDPLRSDQIDMAAAVQSVSEIYTQGVETIEIKPNLAAKLTYSGARDNNFWAHKAMADYLTDRDMKITYPIIEEYVTDPSQEPDPSKWETHIYYYFGQAQ